MKKPKLCPWHNRVGCECLDCPDCLAGDCDTHLTIRGRSVELVSEYASTCDLCGELTSHELMAMDQETQLGYCENCFAKAKKLGLLVTNIGNDFGHLPPGPKEER